MKKMIQELNEKSQADEKRVSEMNVTVENLNMNVSLQHRTVMGLVEDRKFKKLKLLVSQNAKRVLTLANHFIMSYNRQGSD